jgi:hypothetical protein
MTSGQGRRAGLLVTVCLVAGPVAAGIALGTGHDVRRAEAARPLFARDSDYVGASACAACHPDHHASWRRTYHASMTQLPDRATVRGRFDGAPVTTFGATATPFERDGRFFFRLPAMGSDGRRSRSASARAATSSTSSGWKGRAVKFTAACRCSGTSARRAGCT